MPEIDQLDVLCEEFELIHGAKVTIRPSKPGEPAAPTTPELSDYLASVHGLSSGQAALCFSGGGIRSAAFCLGVLQALSKRGLLSRMHYLSTVSGGGYIGAWLTAWADRAARSGMPFEKVEKDFGRRAGNAPTESEPLRWLRGKQRFLTPRAGLLSGDLWAAIALFVRDLLLNWLVFLPALLAILLIPRMLELFLVWWAAYARNSGSVFGCALSSPLTALGQCLSLRGPAPAFPDWRGATDVGSAIFVLLAMVSTFAYRTSGFDSRLDDRRFVTRILLPLVAGGIVLVMFLTVVLAGGTPPDKNLFWQWVAGVPIVFVAARLIAWTLTAFRGQLGKIGPSTPWDVPMLAVSAGVVGALIWGGLRLRSNAHWGNSNVTELAVFGVPFLLLAFVAGQIVYAALACRTEFGRRDQEWMGRASGFYLLTAILWSLVAGLVLYARHIGLEIYAVALAALGVTGTITIATAVSAVTKATGTLAAARERVPASILVQASAAAFVLLTVLLFSAADCWLLRFWTTLDLNYVSNYLVNLLFAAERSPGSDLADAFLARVQSDAAHALWLTFRLAAILACTSLVLSLLVDVNLFSLHALYRNRLVRTFLGASSSIGAHAAERSSFTGFSAMDDIPMGDLWCKRNPLGKIETRKPEGNSVTSDDPVRERRGPFPVINIALNLVATRNMAWQERKAAPFVATPLHVGSALLGYMQHDQSHNRRHLTLGTAMAISGAAASPNWGYHSSPLIGFIMMLFNVRLGWWLENPAKVRKGKSNFLRSARLFTQEALGQTREDDAYIYLSDGGHFDNLGIYEMLRRRCSLIVAVDATQDQDVTLEDLGRTLRQAAIDLGIEVRFPPMPFQKRTNPASAGTYATIGTITYPEEGSKQGRLIFLKPGYFKDAPADVWAYGAANVKFPHDATYNQWFTESQFESYRALGEHAIDQLCGPGSDHLTLFEFSEKIEERLRADSASRPDPTAPQPSCASPRAS